MAGWIPGQLDTGQLDTGQLDTGQLDTGQLDIDIIKEFKKGKWEYIGEEKEVGTFSLQRD